VVKILIAFVAGLVVGLSIMSVRYDYLLRKYEALGAEYARHMLTHKCQDKAW